MADNNFFEESQIEESIAPVEGLIKVGEKEYSQDDLSKLVGLGELAHEAEEKWNTPINKVFPKFTKATQELADSQRRIAELEAKQNPTPAEIPQPGQLTVEQRTEAARQLRDLGFIPKEDVQQLVQAQLQAKDLLGNIDSILGEAREAGNPTTTPQELLEHMQETGIRSPLKAYKDMFEVELDALKEKKLATIKGNGIVTTSSSTAGSKNPAPIKVTRDNLSQLVSEGLYGGNN